jgi:mRNA interferase HigB
LRVIAKRPLVQFWTKHPEAEKPLRSWLTICTTKDFENFAQLKQTFGTVDKVGKFIVFDIGGNKFRLIVVVHFNRKRIYVRAILTHREYDQDQWKNE